GSVSWRSLFHKLRALRPSSAEIGEQWPLLWDVLDNEGSMGVTEVKPELLRAWAQSNEARRHAVAFMEDLRYPLLYALREALEPAFPELQRDARGELAGPVNAGRRPEVTVGFLVPAGGEMRVWAQLWAWQDFRFVVSARYPSDDRSPEAKEAISALARTHFDNWKDSALWRALPLDDDFLARPNLPDDLVVWAKEAFEQIAVSGVLSLAAAPLVAEADDEI
ncbi:MAG: hypothetical protein ABR583_06255, partial [Gaiellaceae bacterium]